MLDIAMIMPVENVNLAPECIDLLIKQTDVPMRIVAIVDGGFRKDLIDLERMMKGLDIPWQLLHNSKYLYYNHCIKEILPRLKSKFVAFIPPEIRMDDRQWFGKMQQVFVKDPHAYLSVGAQGTKSATLPPLRLPRTIWHDFSSRVALLRLQELVAMGIPEGGEEPLPWWVSKAQKMGGTAWICPGARFMELEHAEHDTWRPEPSAKPIRSKWQ